MPEWLKVAIGVLALTVAPTIPAIYFEYLWIISSGDDRTHTAAENHPPDRNQRYALPLPTEPRAAKDHPVSDNHANQPEESKMKTTDLLVVVVSVMQLAVFTGQLFVYRRQADIMDKTAESLRNQSADMRIFQRAEHSADGNRAAYRHLRFGIQRFD